MLYMKKTFLVTSLVVITALSFAPTAKAFSINIPGLNFRHEEKAEIETRDDDKLQKCKKISHGTEVSEEHESEQAEIHEQDGKREACETPAPTSSPTGTPQATATPNASPASTPTGTPQATATPTSSPSGSPTATPTVTVTGAIDVKDLIDQIRQLFQELVKSLRD